MMDDQSPPPIIAPPTRAGQLELSERPPAWPVVVGIIAIIYGTLGILGTVFGLAMMAASPESGPGATANAATNFFESTSWYIYSTATSLVTAALIFAVGIGLVRRRRWSVTAGKLWAWATIALATLGVLIAALMFDEMVAAAQSAAAQGGTPFGAGGMTTFIVVSIIIGFVISVIFPIFLLGWFARVHIRQHIATWA